LEHLSANYSKDEVCPAVKGIFITVDQKVSEGVNEISSHMLMLPHREFLVHLEPSRVVQALEEGDTPTLQSEIVGPSADILGLAPG
jgi:hypothetical protein